MLQQAPLFPDPPPVVRCLWFSWWDDFLDREPLPDDEHCDGYADRIWEGGGWVDLYRCRKCCVEFHHMKEAA